MATGESFFEKNAHAANNPAEQTERVLSDEQTALAETLLSRLEAHPDPLLTLLSDISESKSTLVSSLAAMPKNALDGSGVSIGTHAERDTFMDGYLKLIGDLPRQLKIQEIPDDEAIAIIAAQYQRLDEDVINQLVETTQRTDTFAYDNYDNTGDAFAKIYEQDADDIDEICIDVVREFETSLGHDIYNYSEWLTEFKTTRQRQSDDMVQQAILENTQEILETLQPQTPTQKIGKFALDVCKIAAGSAIGFLIAHKLDKR